jgi:uncharacterized protein YbjQ (UPF0145 family)
MRILLILLTIILFSGCTPKLVQWETDYIIDGYDFRKYTEEGFLFTPNAYSDDYKSIALINILFVPEIDNIQGNPFNKPIENSERRVIWYYSDYYYVEESNPKIMVQNIYELAKDLGGDAVTNFKISTHYLSNGKNGEYEIETLKVTGFVIDRMD